MMETDINPPRGVASRGTGSEPHAVHGPLVSVIIPVLNGEDYIALAIESVLAQTMREFELIIIDDGSTDDTAGVVNRYDDDRIVYHYQPNRGLSAARNAGIRRARAKWLAFLDCDDYWHAEKLEAQLARAASAPDAGLVYCATSSTTMAGEFVYDIPARIEGHVLPQLLYGNRVAGSASSAMVRRDVLATVGEFDEALRCSEDWDMWLRVSSVTSVARVETPLVCCSNTPGSLGKNIGMLRDANRFILDRAFASYAAELTHLRRQAYESVHLTAAVNFQESGLFADARRELLRAARYNPLNLRIYWRLARAIVGRR